MSFTLNVCMSEHGNERNITDLGIRRAVKGSLKFRKLVSRHILWVLQVSEVTFPKNVSPTSVICKAKKGILKPLIHM